MQTRHCETLANHRPENDALAPRCYDVGTMSTASDRDVLHRLIDALRPEDVGTAHRVLEALNASPDPLLLTLSHAPIDDEPETDAEREAVARAHDDIREGKTLSHDEVRRKLRRA